MAIVLFEPEKCLALKERKHFHGLTLLVNIARSHYIVGTYI